MLIMGELECSILQQQKAYAHLMIKCRFERPRKPSSDTTEEWKSNRSSKLNLLISLGKKRETSVVDAGRGIGVGTNLSDVIA